MSREYRRSIVTFIDILGFRQILEERSAHEIFQMLDRVREFADFSDRTARVFESSALQFSDSVIRVIPLDSRSNLLAPNGLLFWELLDLVHIQAELANNEIFIRGAVTVGDMAVQENHYFGPALVRAYELEHSVATYPRIVVDPDVLFGELWEDERLQSSHNLSSDEWEYITRLLRPQPERFYHVDYLNGIRDEAETIEHYLEFIANHGDLIAAGLKNSESDSVRMKYEWLLDYHNEVVQQLSDNALDERGWSPEDLICEHDLSIYGNS